MYLNRSDGNVDTQDAIIKIIPGSRIADTSQIHMEYIEGWPDTHQDTYLEPYLRPDVGGATTADRMTWTGHKY
jgi:hypothetical protein